MPSIINEDIKVDVTMHEEQSGPTLVEDSTPEYLSWSLTTTYAKFWKSVTYCILVIFGAVFDGYALTGTSSKQNGVTLVVR
jgi:hypothetical protein